MKQILVYIPDNLQFNTAGFLQGITKTINSNTCHFITHPCPTKSPDVAIGLCGPETPNNERDNWIHLNSDTQEVMAGSESLTCIYYDYTAFKKFNPTELLAGGSNNEFKTLTKAVNEEVNYAGGFSEVAMYVLGFILRVLNSVIWVLNKFNFITQYVEFLIYIKSYFLTTKWIVQSSREHGKFKLEAVSLMISRLLDVVFGVIAIYYYLKYEEYVLVSIQQSAEFAVFGLKHVLNTLMDSPAGLKLNDALNKTLSVFFFYHISLWYAFIESLGSSMRIVTWLLVLFVPFGLSFQVSVLSNIISFLTFHVYCIYVYAARLYGVQLYGLTSLWKLFIGRKRNPLRDRVDSFQYSHNQLFVGTLGFTVLLFLMPTTFLYYAVFTMFRIILILIKRLLDKIIYVLQNIPLYMVLLWIGNSYKARGVIHLKTIKNEQEKTLTLHATLKKFSLWKCIFTALPPASPVNKAPTMAISDLIKGALTGTLL